MSSTFPELSTLLLSNEQWASEVAKNDRDFFRESAKRQTPKVLWIGCADSRVPESVIMTCKPGEIFVHRNIANQFHLDDDSALSVLIFAVENLGVDHVIVAGHTRCGGVLGAFNLASSEPDGPSSNPLRRWLTPLSKIASHPDFAGAASDDEKVRLAALTALSEASARAQAANICETDVIQRAWKVARGIDGAGWNGSGSLRKKVYVHAWMYEVENGRLRDLGVSRGPDGPVV